MSKKAFNKIGIEDYSIKSLIIDACDTYDEEAEHYDDENDAIHEMELYLYITMILVVMQRTIVGL